MSYIVKTLPTAYVHPRIAMSDVNGPSVSSVKARVSSLGGPYYNYLINLVNWCNSHISDPSSYWYGKDSEYLGAYAFIARVAPAYGSIASKAVSVAMDMAAQDFSGDLDDDRLSLVAMALVYDWAYDFLNSTQRATLRTKISDRVNAKRTPNAEEKFWGHSHSKLFAATVGLIAIMGDDPSMNSTWESWMESILQHWWDGDEDGSTYWAIFRHYGSTDGGTSKGSGAYGYIEENETYYNILIPALESGLGIDVDSYCDWWWKTLEWQLWHQRSDRTFHRQGDNKAFCHYHFCTQVHAMQYVQRFDTNLARNIKWLENEIVQASMDLGGNVSYKTWGPYYLYDCLYRESRVAVTPDVDTLGSMKVFRNTRKIVFRDGWGTDKISMTVAAGRFIGGHQKPAEEAGHFDLAVAGAPILVAAGSYDENQTTTYKLVGSSTVTGHRYSYHKNANAFNICTIYDSNEVSENQLESFQREFNSNTFFGSRDGAVDTVANVGGVLWPKDTIGTKYQPGDLAAMLDEAKWNHETFSIEPIENSQRCYAVLNLLPKYYASKLTRYKRHFVWIKRGTIRSSWQWPIIVIWDDMVTHTGDAAGNRTQEFQLVTPIAPDAGSAGGNVSYTRWDGRVVVRMLQPSGALATSAVGPHDRQLIVYPISRSTSYDDTIGGIYRRSMHPPSETDQPSFLTVLFPCSSATPVSSIPGVELLVKSGYVGVVFSADGLQLEIKTGDTHSAEIVPEGSPPPAATNDVRRSLASIFGFLCLVPPVPEGSISGVDKQHLAGLYRGIPVADWDPPVPPGTSPPSAPTGLVGTAGNTQVELDWNDNPETDFSHYLIYRSENGQPWVVVGQSADSYFLDTSVTNGTPYNYRVTAVDTQTDESDPSDETGDLIPVPLPPEPPPTPTTRSISDADSTPTGVAGRSISDADVTTVNTRSISEADETPAGESTSTIGDRT